MPNIRKQLNFKDKDLWYLVGLIATDGNLSSDGRHIDITAKDPNFLEELKENLGLENKVTAKHNRSGTCFHIQFANRNFYDFLLSIGLTPKKSLTLGELKIPTGWFSDFIRGVIDGDGSIRKWVHASNGVEQWSLSIYSGSSIFIDWLKQRIEKHCSVTGQIHKDRALYVLKFGKLAAKRILGKCYYEGCLGLNRKAMLAKMCGTVDAGWSKSKTLLCMG